MRSKLRTLEGDGDVGVAHLPAALADESHDFREKDFAVDAFPFIGRVGEEMADVPEGEGPEEGVAQGVDGDVAVRMGNKARFRRDAHPAQPHRQPFGEGVHVISVSDSEFHIRKGNEKIVTFVNGYICKLTTENTAMAIFNFGFFGNQEHRVFNYKPRYYDPEEEERRRMFGDVDGTNEKAKAEGKYVPGSSIRGAWRDGNYKRTRNTASRTQAIIGIITLLLIALVLIYITKIYGLLGV